MFSRGAGSIQVSLLQGVKRGVRGLLRKTTGYDLVRPQPIDARYGTASHDPTRALPAGAKDYLRSSNPRRTELRAAYAAVDLPIAQRTHWGGDYLDRELDLTGFRGDNAYVFQFRNVRSDARLKYYFYLRNVAWADERGLLKTLTEDGAFGCWTFEYPGWPMVSRDLLDSIHELYFLQRHLKFLDQKGWGVLDVGAGYGRLAYRTLTAVPALEQYVCTDAVPESTFLCEYYLGYRQVRERADIVPLHQLDRLGGRRYDLALNIHTFSEMSYAAIDDWLGRVAQLQVPWLLVIPNDADRFLSTEAETDEQGLRKRRPFEDLFDKHGYALAVKEPMFADFTMREFMCVTDHFFLFRRRGT